MVSTNPVEAVDRAWHELREDGSKEPVSMDEFVAYVWRDCQKAFVQPTTVEGEVVQPTTVEGEAQPTTAAFKAAFLQYQQEIFNLVTIAPLDKHGFGYAWLLSLEFYFPDSGPKDALALAGQNRPDDALKPLRTTLDEHWQFINPKVGGRVPYPLFEDYFVKHYRAELQMQSGWETEDIFKVYLKQVFDVGLAMMKPKTKDSLGGHCFRYAALLVGEFFGSHRNQLGLNLP